MTAQLNAARPTPRYADLFEDFTPEEQALLPQLKRFFECFEGDRQLRAAFVDGTVTDAQIALLREIGITFDLEQLSPLWKRGETFLRAWTHPEEAQTSDEVVELLKANPLLDLWARFMFRRAELYVEQRRFCTTNPGKSEKYSAWRQRRIAATRSELGPYGFDIDHPSVAIELAVGCSVACYFCAFDARRLEKVFDYNVPENRTLFRGVGASLRNVLGWSSGHALLYWSTEPADNPHYIDFMRDYEEVTGATVCTATARADEKWVADLLEFYRRGPLPWPRISVLTRSIMYKLHKRFTPEECRDMTLLMQQKDAEDMRTKVPGGRDKMLARLASYTDLRELDTDRTPDNHFVAQGSIACVSGFLINLVERTIKLISPCYTSERYRYGYRVFDEATFADAGEFDRELRAMIERKMVLSPYPAMPMRFRDDLRYRAREGGFQLTSMHQVHQCTGSAIHAPLGELLQRGTLTYDEVCGELTDRHNFDPFQVVAIIKGLFDNGFLDELEVVAPAWPAAASSPMELAAQ